MHVPERIEYLNKFRKDGDIKSIAAHYGLSVTTVGDIINGKFYGTHGEKVLQKLEEMIEERAKTAKIIARKYKKKMKDSI